MGAHMGAHGAADGRRSFAQIPFRDYREIREHVRTGDLLLCAGNSGMSRMIQRATRSPWSHVALILRVESIDRVLVVESVESVGVRAVPLSHYAGDAEAGRAGYDGELLIARHRGVARLDDVHLREVLRVAIDLLGREYDTREILRIAGRILAGRRRGETPEVAPTPLRRDDAYICSEFVWECLRAAGIRIAHDSRGFIAPCDFLADKSVEPLFRIELGRGNASELSTGHAGD